jgi:hypothetical protein
MLACLLSAGPSLPRVRPDGYDVYIGVNTAVELHLCDYWSCGDQDRFELIAPKCIGNPALYTLPVERDKMLARNGDLINRHRKTDGSVLTWTDVFDDVGAPPKTASWSSPSCIPLAVYLGATEIHCYGVDFAGSADCTGEETTHRHAERWEREQVMAWNPLVEWAGIPVTRYGAESILV